METVKRTVFARISLLDGVGGWINDTQNSFRVVELAIWYHNVLFKTLDFCQNTEDFTAQTVNLNICKFLKYHLGSQGSQDGINLTEEGWEINAVLTLEIIKAKGTLVRNCSLVQVNWDWRILNGFRMVGSQVDGGVGGYN